MIPEWPDGAAEAFRRAVRTPLATAGGDVCIDRDAIEALLPHRAPFLLVHGVTHVDYDGGILVGRFDLSEARDVLAGHFPGRPVFPGALQIEAIGQAALLLALLQQDVPPAAVALTHVLGARFLKPVGADGELVIAVQAIEDGLFTTAVGQCAYNGVICSVAGVSCVID